MSRRPLRKPDLDAPLSPDQAFGERVAAVRRRRGWTAKELARRVVDVEGGDPGSPVDVERARSRTRDIEAAGRRTATIRDLTTYAAALNVSPLALLAPDGRAETIAVGRYTISAGQARSWFRGNLSLTGTDTLFEEEQGAEHREALRRYSPLLRRLLAHVDRLVEGAGRSPVEDLVGTFDALNDILDDTFAIRNLAQDRGVRAKDVEPGDSKQVVQRFLRIIDSEAERRAAERPQETVLEELNDLVQELRGQQLIDPLRRTTRARERLDP